MIKDTYKSHVDGNGVTLYVEHSTTSTKERNFIIAEYKHKGNLPEAVMEAIKPIYKDLAKTELLTKCLEGYTQNANESLNSVIWKYCPKAKNHGLRSVNIAVALAVCTYNDGASTFMAILREMDIQPGNFMTTFCEDKDTVRVRDAQRQAKECTKEARRAKRQRRLAQDEHQVQREGQPYLAGAH